MTNHHQVLIIGGGTGGITVAAQLLNADKPPQVAIVEPSDKHYYQPIWTLVGGGVFSKDVSERPMADFIPNGAQWIRASIETFEPENKTVVTCQGARITYDYLIIAAGIQIDWSGIENLAGNVGKHGICSNYGYDTVDSTWDNIRSFKGGNAIFTMPDTPIKCGGAPQKIMYLADDYFRTQGIREKSNVIFASAKGGIFGVPKYRDALNKVVARKDIDTRFRHDLFALEPDKKKAYFKNLDNGQTISMDYDMIHVVPPMSAPDFIKKSPLSDAKGWLDVDKHTLQHTRFPNIFGVGDCTNTPTAKTGAAIRKQAPTLVANLLAHMAGAPLDASYDGYSSCPLVTGYGKLILAEFDYQGQPVESFPFNQAEERYSMYALKAYGLPRMYWHGMLRGRA